MAPKPRLPQCVAAAKEAGRWLFAVVADLANGHQRGGDEGDAADEPQADEERG